jgi:hypothetical protein
VPETNDCLRLQNFRKVSRDGGVRLSCSIDGTENHPTLLFFDIDATENNCARITPDPSAFVIAMTIPAMERGLDLHVDGAIDDALLFKLNYYVVPFLSEFHPFLRRIKITADSTAAAGRDNVGLGAMTGMSCGVDSLETAARFADPELPLRYQVRSLAVFDVGAFNDETPQLALEKRDRIATRAQEIASDCGHDFYLVASNLAEYYQTNFPKSVSMRNVACAFALSDICETYLGACSVGVMNMKYFAGKSGSMDLVDQILYPMFAGTRLEILSASVDINRNDKIIWLLNHSAYVEQIDICTSSAKRRPGGKNCGTCPKCGGFLRFAEAHGQLDRFTDKFDIARYQRRRWRVFQKDVTEMFTAQTKSQAEKAFSSLADLGFQQPKGAMFVGRLIAWKNRVRRKLRH